MNFSKNKFPVYKPVGPSPLDIIKALKYEYPSLREEKMAYAGRLDPMAEGVLLLIKGGELKDFDKYLNLDKSYRGKIIPGLFTDSYDLLGLPKKRKSHPSQKEIVEKLKSFKGKIKLPFPPYSSYKIKGKRLFEWAREGRLSEIEIPEFEAKIYTLEVKQGTPLTGRELNEEILKRISSVTGDFRQEEIKKEWNNLLKPKDKFKTVEFELSCSSGFYVRSLANHFNSVLFELQRTKVADYKLRDCFWFD